MTAAQQVQLVRSDGATLEIDIAPEGTADYLIGEPFNIHGTTDDHNDDQPAPIGETGAADGEGARTMTVDVVMRSNDPTVAYEKYEALRAFCRPSVDEMQFGWNTNGLDRMRYVRSRGTPGTEEAMNEGFTVTLQMRQQDPFDYGPEITTSLPKNSDVSIDGGGNELTHNWKVTIPGPVTNPVIEYTGPGGTPTTVDVSWAATSGQSIEFRLRGPRGYPSVVLIDTDGARGSIRSSAGGLFLPMSEGDRTVTFTASSGGTGGATLVHRDAI